MRPQNLPEPEHFCYPKVLAFVQQTPSYTSWYDAEKHILWLPYQDDSSRKVMSLGCHPTTHLTITGDPEVARKFFQLTLDLSLADQQLTHLQNPVGRALYERHRGMRPPLFLNPFEGIVWAILGQQITVRFAMTLKSRLMVQFGSPWHDRFLFPSPDRLSECAVDQLREMQLSRNKARYIISLAQSLTAHQFSLDALRELSTPDAYQQLTTLPGIGPWTAEYALLRIFGRLDVIPAKDVVLRLQWGQLLGLSRHATEDELRDAAQAWHPWEGLLAFYLLLDRRMATNTLAIPNHT